VCKLLKVLRRLVLLKSFQQPNQMMHTAVGLLGARLEQIIKLSVASEEFLNGEHDSPQFYASAVGSAIPELAVRAGPKWSAYSITPRMMRPVSIADANSFD
jgi:hypothetical protein